MSTKKQRYIHRNANGYRNKSFANQTGTVIPQKKVVEISPATFEELRIEFENIIKKEIVK